MLSSKSKFVSVLIAMMLVLSLTIPVFAQDEGEPVDEPVVEEVEPVEEPEGEETSSKFLDHPIVKLFAEFFASFFNPPEEEEPVPDEVDGTGEGGDPGELPPDDGGEGDLDGDAGGEGDLDGEEDGEPAEPPIVPGEKIASMHGDDKLGFGVISKLIGIVQCPESEVTLDELVAQFKGGIGMGELYDTYCKPKNLGVGHIRKALKELNPEAKTNNGKGKNK